MAKDEKAQRKSGPRGRMCVFLALALASARTSAHPLRASGERDRGARRTLTAVLLVLALVAPLVVTAPFGVWADEESDATEATADGLPFWQALRGVHPDAETGDVDLRPWTDQHLHDVHFATEEVGYAVGANGTVLRTADAGESWQVWRLSDGDGGTLGTLRGVHVVEAGVDEDGEPTGVDVVVAVGDDGTLVRTDGAETWVRLDMGLPDGVHLHAVDFPTGEVGYAVGDFVGAGFEREYTVLRSTDAGASWQQLTVPDATGFALRAVHFVDEDTGVAVGGSDNSGAYLRREAGEEPWSAWTTTIEPKPVRGVALLEPDGLGYAVGARDLFLSPVVRTTDGFVTQAGHEARERTLGDLHGVAAYWATPVSAALHRVESAVADGPSGARDDLADAIDDLAEELGPHDDSGLLVEVLEGLAEDVRNEGREEVDGPWDGLFDALDGVLGDDTQEVRDLLAGELENAAETIEGQETDNEDADEALGALADALERLADVVGAPDAAREVREVEQGLGAELVHAVGVEDDLPVALTRHGTDGGQWAVEPIEDWDAHQGSTLRAVSASPGAGTIVAVGDNGLMLRRVAATDPAPRPELCVPERLVDPLEDSDQGLSDKVPVCRADDPDEPDDREVLDVPPPFITLDRASGAPGTTFEVTGEAWRACDDPAEQTGCEGSQVTLTFRQDGEVFALGTVEAGDDGAFEADVEVPQGAVVGDATVRAAGDPEPDGGASDEVAFRVPTPPTLVFDEDERRPSSPHWPENDEGEMRVSQSDSVGWHACGDGGCEGVDVEFWFLQEGREDVLLTDEPVRTVDDGRLRDVEQTTVILEVPHDAVPGEATVRARAVGEPAPDGGTVAEAVLTVLPPLDASCEIGEEQVNPELACLTEFEFTTEEAETVTSSVFVRGHRRGLQFVPGIGEVDPDTGEPVGRVVAVHLGRVFLYDVSDKHVEVVSVAADGGSADVTVNEQAHEAVEPGDELAMGFVVDDIVAVESDDSDGGEDVRWCVGFRLAWAPADTDLEQATFEVCEGERVQQGLTQRGVPGFSDGFTGDSKHGDVTGVVNLAHAESLSPDPEDGTPECYDEDGDFTCFLSPEEVGVALDTVNHRLYFQVGSGGEVGADFFRHIVAVSLTGEFAPTHDDGLEASALPASRISHLAVDGGHSVLYAVTTTANTLANVVATTSPPKDARIHAVPTRVDDGRLIFEHGAQRGWSLHIGEQCDATRVSRDDPRMLAFFGVSEDGRRLHLPCASMSFTNFGYGPVGPNGILHVALPDDRPPDELTDADTGDFVARYEPVPGGGVGCCAPGQQVLGDQAAGVLVWKVGGMTLVWDLDEAQWVGRVTGGGDLVAADPGGTLYLDGGGQRGLTYFQVTNLPGDVARRGVDPGFGNPSTGGAFDPATRRLVVGGAPNGLAVLEDRIPPTIPEGDTHPDEATHDIDEAQAFSVDRRGDTSAFGARLWSTGLRGILPGTFTVRGEGFPQPELQDQAPPASLTWDWLFRSGTPHGVHTQRVPSSWRPHARDRELFSARVPAASFTSDDRALTGASSARSRAEAVGLDVDEGTGGDARQRRGAREWRDVLDVYMREGGCSLLVGQPQANCEAQVDEHWRGFAQAEEAEENTYRGWELVDHVEARRSFVAEGELPDEDDDSGQRRFDYGRADAFVANADEVSMGEWGCVLDETLAQDADHALEIVYRPEEEAISDFTIDTEADLAPCLDPDEERTERDPSPYEQWQAEWTGEDAQAFDDCVDELWDRGLREIDGERRVRYIDERDPDDPDDDVEDPCSFLFFDFESLDEHDEDATWNEDEGQWENDRPGAEQRPRSSLTQLSNCVADTAGSQERMSWQGSTAFCDVDGEQTVALAKNAFGDDELFAELPGGVTVSVEATFTLTRSYRDPERGLVSEANAFAQGVELGVPGQGGLRIGQVSTRAETWAGGRPGTADSEYTVAYSDVALTGPAGEELFSCRPDGQVIVGGEEQGACDVEEVAFRVNQAFGGIVEVSVPARDFDERMVGTPRGAQARVQRDRADYWNDRILFGVNQDEVSGLQIRLIADGTEFNRYQVDLAGVFAGSSYLIGQPWDAPEVLPGSLEVSLVDHDGAPLAGGGFELAVDADGDGVLSEADAAVRGCVTGSDGVGDCLFSSLEPGDYLVRQTSAPDGYRRQEEPRPVRVASQSEQTVEFVNVREAGTVEVTLTDPDDAPLSGGAFDLAHEDGGTESCVTDADGRCELWPLPLGGYTLTQAQAPEGFEPAAEPVAFELTEPGQVARITVVNGFPGTEGTRTVLEIVEFLDGEASPAGASAASAPGDEGGWWRRAADGMRSLLRDPWQALALALVVVLAATPVYLAVRRRELGLVRALT